MHRIGGFSVLTAAVLALAGGCSADSLAESWAIAADGISVTVKRDPFGFAVVDASGKAVLRSLGSGDGDGFGSLAWAEGRTSWETVYSPGYYRLTTDLKNWRDDFVVVGARRKGSQLDLELSPRAMKSNPDERLQVAFILRPSTLRVEVQPEGRRPRVFAAAFAAPPDEGFLGFGERFNRTNQRGVDVYCWAEEGGIGTGEGQLPGPDNPFPNGEAMAYYPVPFFLSTEGYAFWLDSTWYNMFNLATAHPDAWRIWHLGPTMAFEVFVPVPGDTRPWPYQLIDLFTAATGRPMIPPPWAFGPRRRIDRTDVQNSVPEIQAMRDLDLALTAADDSTHLLPRGSHVGHEAEIQTWTQFAGGLGAAACGYYNPYLAVGEDTPLQSEVDLGLANGWFLKDANGQPSEVWLISGGLGTMLTVDFTSPEATAWYHGMLQWGLDLGYSGWMYDFGEYVQPNVLTASGMTGEEFHNLFPVLYQKAAFDKMENGPTAGRWLTFVRSGYTGAWAYAPVVWSGDPAASFESSDGLPSMVRAGVNLGMSGAPHWGGDINGFHCTADGYKAATEELLIRWIQQGSMSSDMHDEDACSGALDSGRKANIFQDPGAQAAWKTYARLHTRLFPYLYSLAHRAHATGEPVMRHVFLEHPDRLDFASVDDAYYLGPALFVAPVIERGATAKTVNLPSGWYLDWHDQKLVQGGQTVVLDAPLEKLPLLLRDGQLVPLLDPSIDTLADEDNPEVVGLGDVGDVYDVVGLLSRSRAAAFALWDGGTLSASWEGGLAAPGLPEAQDDSELSTCGGCYRSDDLGGGLLRERLSVPDGQTAAGGLNVSAQVGRRVRWDLYLVE